MAAVIAQIEFAEVEMNMLKAASATLLVACCTAGCATPAPASSTVRATTTSADVAGCSLLGKVIVADGANAEKEAREETARLGGNVLLRKTESVWNGNAYLCKGSAH